MNRIVVETALGPIAAWRGGQGQHLFLIHGGWAGAEAHWSTVWGALSQDFDVTAIEMDGIWNNLDRAPKSYDALADRCAALLDALGIGKAIVVGNSLGASVGWQLVLRRPDCVAQLMMVDGFPPRPLPMRWLFGLKPFSTLAIGSVTKNFYSDQVMTTGFNSEDKVPDDIRRNLTGNGPAMAGAMFSLLQSVRQTPATPTVPVDYLWGQSDILPGVTLADAEKLRAATPGARLFVIPDARHLPQVDNPDVFVRTLKDAIRG